MDARPAALFRSMIANTANQDLVDCLQMGLQAGNDRDVYHSQDLGLDKKEYIVLLLEKIIFTVIWAGKIIKILDRSNGILLQSFTVNFRVLEIRTASKNRIVLGGDRYMPGQKIDIAIVPLSPDCGSVITNEIIERRILDEHHSDMRHLCLDVDESLLIMGMDEGHLSLRDLDHPGEDVGDWEPIKEVEFEFDSQ